MMTFLTSKYTQMRLATSFLTRLPVADIEGEVPTLCRCLWACSIVGMIIGGAVYALFTGLYLIGFPALIASFIALGAGMVLTGGLHEDGFGDMLDGFGGGHDKSSKLAIMKDSHIGSYATIGLIVIIGIRAVSLASLIPAIPHLISIMIVAGASRFFMVSALSLLPPAREDGLGYGYAGKVSGNPLIQLLPSFLIILICGFFAPSYVLGVILAMAAISGLIGLIAHRQIGGQTGDICGAIQLASETTGFVMLVVLG